MEMLNLMKIEFNITNRSKFSEGRKVVIVTSEYTIVLKIYNREAIYQSAINKRRFSMKLKLNKSLNKGA